MRSLKNNNRRGATTLFLSVILSAIILVECTYIGLVEELRCNLAYSRGVKLQVETFLSEYDRTLLKTYGIYAFDIDSIDPYIFELTLQGSGIEAGTELYVCGVNSFDTDDLRDAISLYYAYRSSGVIFTAVSDYIVEALDSVDDLGILNKLRSFMNSGASDVLMDIIDGVSTASEEIAQYASELGIEDISEYIDDLSEFIDMFDQLGDDGPDIGGGYSPRDMTFGIEAVTDLYNMMDSTADIISGPVFHGFAVNYAGYNFDCVLDDDHALDGTSFTQFHEGDLTDTEYILTGLEGNEGLAATCFLVFQFLFVIDVVKTVTDPEKMEWIDGIATVLSALIEIISLGTIPATPEVCKAVIIIYVAQLSAKLDLSSLISGERITLIEIGSLPAIDIGYREIVNVYMNFIPDSVLLTRMTEIINRDFPGKVCGVSLGTIYNGNEITYSRTYDIYENESYE